MNYLALTSTQVLKHRMKKAKETIGCVKESFEKFTLYVEDKEPSYKCREGWNRINNTWYGRSTDIRVIELAIEFAESLTKAA